MIAQGTTRPTESTSRFILRRVPKGFKVEIRATLKLFCRRLSIKKRMTNQTLTLRIQTRKAKIFTLLAALLVASLAPVESADTAIDPAAASGPVTQPAAQPPLETESKRAALGSVKKSREQSTHEEWMETVGISIGFVAVVFGIGIAFFAIWVDYRKRHELLKICHEERMAALDKGLDLPPFPTSAVNDPEDVAMLGLRKEPPKQSNGLKPGLILLGVGTGGAFGFSWSFSGILIGIGAAFLVYYVVEGRKLQSGKSRSAE